MKFYKTEIDGCYIIEYNAIVDNRGFFSVPYNRDVFNEKIGREVNFVQDNLSSSHYGVIRGLHFQNGEFEQAK